MRVFLWLRKKVNRTEGDRYFYGKIVVRMIKSRYSNKNAMEGKGMELERFHKAQEYSYETALAEIKKGRKSSHWMWYIFPQIAGLGRSSTAQYYAIQDLQEAVNYINDEILGKRLVEISEALLALETNDAYAVFGCPDNMKLKSSMTLFTVAAPEYEVFWKVLDKFFKGQQDKRTIQLLK